MKKSIFILLFAFAMISVLTTNATETKTRISNCEITELDDLHFGKSIKKVWTLNYTDNEAPVTVVKRKTLEGIEYVVYAKHFEVSYLSTHEGFGVKNIKKSWRMVPAKITKAVINEEQMKRQQVITTQNVDDEYAIGLIAGFLPDLLNKGYEHLLS
jgi:hypothetical protein